MKFTKRLKAKSLEVRYWLRKCSLVLIFKSKQSWKSFCFSCLSILMLFQTWKFTFRGVGIGKPRKANGLYVFFFAFSQRILFFLLFFLFVYQCYSELESRILKLVVQKSENSDVYFTFGESRMWKRIGLNTK